MDLDLSALLGENPEWGLVLAAYDRAEEAAIADRASQPSPPPSPSPSPSHEPIAADEAEAEAEEPTSRSGRPWIPRLVDIFGVQPERLAPIHGKLIAYGLLNFLLEGRDAGVSYRLTGEARRLLQTFDAAVDVAEQRPQAA